MNNLTLLPLILASASLSSLATPATAVNSIAPPRISLQQLRSASAFLISSGHGGGGEALTNLHQLLFDSGGILRIAVGRDDDKDRDKSNSSLSDLRRSALTQLCVCPTFSPSGNDVSALHTSLKSHPRDLQQITLPDGTVRRTLATASIGFGKRGEGDAEGIPMSQQRHATSLKLPSWVRDDCGQEAYDSLEELRDVVAEVAGIFVERLDQENILSDEGRGVDRTYRQILSSANHFEHFHLYSKPRISSLGDDGDAETLQTFFGVDGDDENDPHLRSKQETTTLDYHTDAGFFLSFIPAMNCHSRTTDNASFYFKGQREPVAFEEDEVVILMGAGAQYWLPSHAQSGSSGDLQKQYPFQAASHALRLSPGTRRAWYGKMHLLPSSSTSHSTEDSLSASVGHREGNHKDHAFASPLDETSLRARSLGAVVQSHVNSPAACDNQTNFFCWHQCIDILDNGRSEHGSTLYCLDPAILISSGSPSIAAESCGGGYSHNSKCVPVYGLSNEAKVIEPDHSAKTDEIRGVDGEPSMKKGRVMFAAGVCGLLVVAYAAGFSFGSKSGYRRLP